MSPLLAESFLNKLGDALILAIPALLALAAGYLDLRRRLVNQHKEMNSRLTQLIDAAGLAGEQKGAQEERERERLRQQDASGRPPPLPPEG